MFYKIKCTPKVNFWGAFTVFLQILFYSSFAPQAEQKAPCFTFSPQCGQVTKSSAPQCLQKFAFSSLGLPHIGHKFSSSPLAAFAIALTAGAIS